MVKWYESQTRPSQPNHHLFFPFLLQLFPQKFDKVVIDLLFSLDKNYAKRVRTRGEKTKWGANDII